MTRLQFLGLAIPTTLAAFALLAGAPGWLAHFPTSSKG